MATSLRRVYRLLTPEYADAAVRCVAETFSSQDDPFTRMGWRSFHWRAMSETFITRSAAAKKPLSIIAFNPVTGEVDGLMCNEDFTQNPPQEYYGLGPDFRAVRAIFKEAHMRFGATREAPKDEGEMLHCLYFTCVRPTARGQGVMKGLWKQTIDVARDNGFSSVVAEASSESVRGVLSEHLGFKEVAAVPYGEFEFANAKHFAALPATDPVEYSRLSIHKRKVPSDLY